jgi:hypothetical protein
MFLRFEEDDLVAVTLGAFIVNGIQVGWTLRLHKEEYIDEMVNRIRLEVNLEADAYADRDYQEEMEMAESRNLDTDDDVAWP